MKKITRLFSVLIAFFAIMGTSVSAQTLTKDGQFPIHSSASEPRWMFIQHNINGGVMELSDSGTEIHTLARLLVNGNERQLWRFERVGENQYKIFNKARAGSFTESGTWDETLTSATAPTFEIKVGNEANKLIIKNVSGNFIQSASETGTVSTVTEENDARPYWAIVETVGGSTESAPVWYQLRSKRTNNITILYDDNGTVKHKSTSKLTDDTQMWRIEETTNGYLVINKASGKAMKMTGALGTANNLTTVDKASAEAFVFSPDYKALGNVYFYRQGTTYQALDYWGDGRLALFNKSQNDTHPNRFLNGIQEYHLKYKKMVTFAQGLIDDAINNPPQAKLDAYQAAVDKLKLAGTLTDLNNELGDFFNAVNAFLAPGISPNGGSDLTGSQTVTLIPYYPGGVLYYTTDGSTPGDTEATILYTGPITITATTTLKAKYGNDGTQSDTSEATFTFSTTGVDKVTLQNGISVNNGIITVKGVEDFEVYSLAGQQVNANRKLQAGIYLVKVKETAVKVVVR